MYVNLTASFKDACKDDKVTELKASSITLAVYGSVILFCCGRPHAAICRGACRNDSDPG